MAKGKSATSSFVAVCMLACYFASVNGQASCPYVIKDKDTFFSIGQAKGVAVGAITALNPGVKPEALQVGQTIQVPCQGGSNPGGGTVPPTDKGPAQQQPAAGGNCAYIIKGGDTLFAIAQAKGIALPALQALNPGVVPEALQVGQSVKVC